MGLFKPYQPSSASQDDKPAVATPTRATATTDKATGAAAKTGAPAPVSPPKSGANPGSPTAAHAPVKKSVPTPKRRDAEQARRDRIQPQLTKKQAKAKEREARYKARDEATARTNARPENTLIRDWVDRRWNLAEFAMPLMLLVFVAVIAGGYFWGPLAMASTYIIWVVFAVLLGDTLWMWIGLRSQLRSHFPGISMRGKFSYAFSRAMLMRRSRQPPPRVKRGSRFVWPHPDDLR